MKRAGDALFLLAHHDDEVFCAGRIARLLHERRRVRLLWVTAGGTAPARLRMREGDAVAQLLGLDPGEHRSLGLPDQGALEHLGDIAVALREMLSGVADLYVCAYEGGHPDHDAVNLAAARTARDGARLHEFSLYRRGPRGVAVKALFPGEPGPPERFLLDRAALSLRRRLAGANASQLPELAVLGVAALLGGRLAMEPVRPLPSHDYERPPYGQRPLYEWYTRRRYEEFRAAARQGW